VYINEITRIGFYKILRELNLKLLIFLFLTIYHYLYSSILTSVPFKIILSLNTNKLYHQIYLINKNRLGCCVGTTSPPGYYLSCRFADLYFKYDIQKD
jgi:hypothetical protein